MKEHNEIMYKYLLEKYPNQENLLNSLFDFYHLDKGFDINLIKYRARQCGKTTIKNLCAIIDFLEDISKGKDKLILNFVSQERSTRYIESFGRVRKNESLVIYSNDMWARENCKRISSYLKSLKVEGISFKSDVITYERYC
jgi:hypothetical protein